jgi:hypothetical protein
MNAFTVECNQKTGLLWRCIGSKRHAQPSVYTQGELVYGNDAYTITLTYHDG